MLKYALVYALTLRMHALKCFEAKSCDVQDLPLGQAADYDLCVLYVVTLRQKQCDTIGAYVQRITMHVDTPPLSFSINTS